MFGIELQSCRLLLDRTCAEHVQEAMNLAVRGRDPLAKNQMSCNRTQHL